MSCRRANAPQGYSYDLSDEDAQELGRRSIIAAGHRDAYSGNTCNLFHVRQDGWEFIGACGVTRRFGSSVSPFLRFLVASLLRCLISWLPHFLVASFLRFSASSSGTRVHSLFLRTFPHSDTVPT
jgi:hypothetical protein